MTPKQQERIKNKIKKIKAALAADKKRWGGYHHDGQGLRYAPPQFYIQIEDYTGGLRYFNWFNKNFPGDGCYPDFLFEWTLILFKTGRLKEAEKKAFETFTEDTKVFDEFFERPMIPVGKSEDSDAEGAASLTGKFPYSYKQDFLTDFSDWLYKVIQSENFMAQMIKFQEIEKLLEEEDDSETRGHLYDQARQLVNKI